MDKKTENTKASSLKTLKVKRETIKDLSVHERKQVKGGGGAPGSVVQDRRIV